MRYYALDSKRALAALEVLRAGESLEQRGMVSFRGAGPELDLDPIKNLGKELYGIKAKYPESVGLRDPAGGHFESEACSCVHRDLPRDPQVLSDPEFWLWLSIAQFWAIVDWRHGGESGHSAPANFGIGSLSENLFYRMWLRADIGYEPERDDAYALAKRGDQDFWRSHLFRQGYGRSRNLAQALIRFQFPDACPGDPTLKIREIRELAKRLRRLDPNLIFDYLDAGDTFQLIKREAEKAKASIVA